MPVWVVNQVARRYPSEVRALVKAGTDLRKAQRAAVSGRDPEALGSATRAHRELLDGLTHAAREFLEERGASVPATIPRVAQTLRAASVDKEAAKALEQGALSEDVEQTGFGPLLAAVPAGRTARPRRRAPAPKRPSPRKPPPKPPDRTREQAAKLRRQLEQARKEARAERREADAAAKHAERAQKKADKAEEQVRALEEKLAQLTSH